MHQETYTITQNGVLFTEARPNQAVHHYPPLSTTTTNTSIAMTPVAATMATFGRKSDKQTARATAESRCQPPQLVEQENCVDRVYEISQ
ncbi:unnamed protein product [Ceratitis capitata]|uniref:(Mediterranean fruit fly) hypothetical protein n=1 Tax=Ceratitis capitata TaxID=7213 RepID=A0A811U7P8_CERCA|nr:unnamed protein product [Ceratitis capitata]